MIRLRFGGLIGRNATRSSRGGRVVQPRQIPCRALALGLLAGLFAGAGAQAQSPDCERIRAQIAAIDQGGGGGGSRGSQYSQAASRQQSEIERTSAYARSLGCDRGGFSFFGAQPPAQCNGLNARIQAMQANLGQLQGMAGRSGGSQRADLVARYNAYCRSQPRGFFDSLFGGSGSAGPGADDLPPEPAPSQDDQTPHGGGQAVCVRTCDGGFFPLNYSARSGNFDTLDDLCRALCPNTEVALYTRNPDLDIGTAVGSDGRPYRDLPNAFKFQKSFDAACTCRPKDASWLQALTQSDAERILGQERKGDILVTPEKSLEMSRPRPDLPPRGKPGLKPTVSAVETLNRAPVADAAIPAEGTQEVIGPDGIKRRVRIVGPTP